MTISQILKKSKRRKLVKLVFIIDKINIEETEYKKIIERIDFLMTESLYHSSNIKYTHNNIVEPNNTHLYHLLITSLFRKNYIRLFYHLKFLLLNERGIGIIFSLYCYKEEKNQQIQLKDQLNQIFILFNSLCHSKNQIIQRIVYRLVILLIKWKKFINKHFLPLNDFNIIFELIKSEYLKIDLINEKIFCYEHDDLSIKKTCDLHLSELTRFLNKYSKTDFKIMFSLAQYSKSINQFLLENFHQLNAKKIKLCLINELKFGNSMNKNELINFLTRKYEIKPSILLFDCLSLLIDEKTILKLEWNDLVKMILRRNEILQKQQINVYNNQLNETECFYDILKNHKEFLSRIKYTLQSIDPTEYSLFIPYQISEHEKFLKIINELSNYDEIIESVSQFVEYSQNNTLNIYELVARNNNEISNALLNNLQLNIIRIPFVNESFPSAILPIITTLYPQLLMKYLVRNYGKIEKRDLMRCIYRLEHLENFPIFLLKLYHKIYNNEKGTKNINGIMSLIDNILLSSLNMKSNVMSSLIELCTLDWNLFFLVVYDFDRKDFYVKKNCLIVIHGVLRKISNENEFNFNQLKNDFKDSIRYINDVCYSKNKPDHSMQVNYFDIENNCLEKETFYCCEGSYSEKKGCIQPEQLEKRITQNNKIKNKSNKTSRNKQMIYKILSNALPSICLNSITSNDKILKQYCIEILDCLQLEKIQNKTVLIIFNCMWNEILSTILSIHENEQYISRIQNCNIQYTLLNMEISLKKIKQIIIAFSNVLTSNFILKYLLSGLEHSCSNVRKSYEEIFSWIEGGILIYTTDNF